MCRIICVSFSLQRWVRAFRLDRFNVKLNTNNGMERQNRSFKYGFLADNCDKTLSGMIHVLVTQFLPSAHKKLCMDRFSNLLNNK